MDIRPGDTPQLTYRDAFSTQCDNNASPGWVATGKGEYFGIWLFATFHKPGCDPLELQFYWDAGSGTLWEDEDCDGVGITWYRQAVHRNPDHGREFQDLWSTSAASSIVSSAS